jgi:hypothetical protein
MRQLDASCSVSTSTAAVRTSATSEQTFTCDDQTQQSSIPETMMPQRVETLKLNLQQRADDDSAGGWLLGAHLILFAVVLYLAATSGAPGFGEFASLVAP